MNPKPPKKELPRLHGEKWELWDGQAVTVLQRLKGGAVEVLNAKGTTQVCYGSEFKRRMEMPPPMEGLAG
jgi:hypothetical protein